jgi:hypothetical protein
VTKELAKVVAAKRGRELDQARAGVKLIDGKTPNEIWREGAKGYRNPYSKDREPTAYRIFESGLHNHRMRQKP